MEFAAPVGYKEPQYLPKKAAAQEDEPMMIDADVLPSTSRFEAFGGSGQRLGGSKKKGSMAAPPIPTLEAAGKKKIDVTTLAQKGIPNYDWKPGKITFRRNIRKPTVSESEKLTPFMPFAGEGLSLKKGPK